MLKDSMNHANLLESEHQPIFLVKFDGTDTVLMGIKNFYH